MRSAGSNRRHVALSTFRRGYEGRRLPQPVRRKAGAAAIDRNADAAMDRFLAANSPLASMSIWRRCAATSCHSGTHARVARIDGDLSDRHNGGRSVLIVTFEDGARIVYKPKDLRLDVAWHDLIARLNGSAPPLELRAVRAIARENYGWTEFIDHTGCADPDRSANGSSAGPAPGLPCFIALPRPTCTRRTSSQPATIRCRSILRPSFRPPPPAPKTQERGRRGLRCRRRHHRQFGHAGRAAAGLRPGARTIRSSPWAG